MTKKNRKFMWKIFFNFAIYILYRLIDRDYEFKKILPQNYLNMFIYKIPSVKIPSFILFNKNY